jgi:uncharacterized membrane protein
MSDEEREVMPPGAPAESGAAAGDVPPNEEVVEAGPAVTLDQPAVAEPKAPEPPATPPAPPPAAIQPADVSDDDRLMAMLAWLTMVIVQLPVLSVVLLLIEPNKSRPFQRYHAVTSTIFWVVALLYEGLAAIVYITLSAVTLGCLALCLWVIFLLPHLLTLYYALKAFNGKYMEIPVISDFARRQGWA